MDSAENGQKNASGTDLLLEVLCEILKETLAHLSGTLILLCNWSSWCSGSSHEYRWVQRQAPPKDCAPWCRSSPWADHLSPDSHNFVTAWTVGSRGCYALRCVGIFLVLFSFFLQMQDSKPQQQQKAILLDLFRTRNIATITIMSLLLW